MTDKLKSTLRASGHSVTTGRLAVFAYLQKHDPASVSAVIHELQDRMDQASIYRVLALFRELDVVQDIITGGQKMVELTDRYDSHHHHISCLQCGKSISIEDPSLEQRLGELARAQGITPISHQIEVSGICVDCDRSAAVSHS